MSKPMKEGRKSKSGGLRSVFGLGMGLAAGIAAGLWMRRPRKRPESQVPEAPQEPMFSAPPIKYEHISRVVWSDDPRRRQGDLEDAESIEALVSGGWELIDVIVPFAQTNQMELAYPGNTRKLIAYFRRPIGQEGEDNERQSR